MLGATFTVANQPEADVWQTHGARLLAEQEHARPMLGVMFNVVRFVEEIALETHGEV